MQPVSLTIGHPSVIELADNVNFRMPLICPPCFLVEAGQTSRILNKVLVLAGLKPLSSQVFKYWDQLSNWFWNH